MVQQMDEVIEAEFKPEMRAAKAFYTARELARICKQTTKRARQRYQLRKLHVRTHVAAVQALDRGLGLLPKGAGQWIRAGLQRQFHRVRRIVHKARELRRKRFADPLLPR